MICFYHSKDHDGYTSGAIVLNKYPNCRMVGWDYGDGIAFNELIEGEEVIIIDISFPMEWMIRISEFSGGKLTWIDHHISAKKEYDNYPDFRKNKINYVYELGKSACEIGWEYFNPSTPMPLFVKLIGRYDVWDNGNEDYWKDTILPFQFYARVTYNNPYELPKSWFDGDTFDKNLLYCLNIGKNIINYQEIQDLKMSMKGAYESQYNDYKILCINTFIFSPQTLSNVEGIENYDFYVGVWFDGRNWNYSLRSAGDVDVSLIAKENGGGGHKMAAGFQNKELIFKQKELC